VRSASWGLGRLERDARLLTLIGVGAVCFAAARADAAPAPLGFAVSVSGTAHEEWDHTGAPTADGTCERTLRSEGIRDARFRTTHPTLVRVTGGRLLAVTIRNLAGTVTSGGANTIRRRCGTDLMEAVADCAQTRRSFRAASVRAHSTRPGSVTLGPLRATLRRSDCPLEPADVVREPLGRVPGPLRVSPAALANRRLARITLTASASRRKNYGPVEAGTLQQRSAWRVTLVRLSP
jgi:hypothetical protein